ncbi:MULTISPECIES: hypothetical protein [Citrobacter]|jgi:hypothetical protein|uniref:hypothetical protein n=1 Tax=Citrobacter TaxID=544 RepID=UPI001B84599C|nr:MULTISPECIES: hypothetical protein [Citrobacter]MBR7617726.1 hypothetical protein [Citrobacter braakii]MDL4471778.1 hypothetical protein [Citrobacter braakii]MDL4503507.1 hypothetical protein [Citrobacter braakii]MDM3379654.1 hypothetical protein [Citrobacter sp. Cb003]
MSLNPFTLELLQAINDWQINSTYKRGQELKILSNNLPEKFRTVHTPCYRKINLGKGGVFSLFGRNQLNEKISSWSTSSVVVTEFKGGVSKKHLIEQSIILKISPKSSDVIINLSEVYKSREFKEALINYGGKIKNVDKGINKYQGGQYEVVLQVKYVTHNNVYMLGGRAAGICVSNATKIRKRCNSELIYDIENNDIYVFRWLSETKTRKVIERMKNDRSYPYNVYAKHYGYKINANKTLKANLMPVLHGVFLKYSFYVDLYAIYFCLLEDNFVKNLKVA